MSACVVDGKEEGIGAVRIIKKEKKKGMPVGLTGRERGSVLFVKYCTCTHALCHSPHFFS